MYKVYGQIPTKIFETIEEAEQYIQYWEDGCESDINTVIIQNSTTK
jgi:hypothetical protein